MLSASGGQQPDHLEVTTILNRGHEIFSAALIDGPRLRERRCTAAVLQHKYHDESNWRLRTGIVHLA